MNVHNKALNRRTRGKRKSKQHNTKEGEEETLPAPLPEERQREEERERERESKVPVRTEEKLHNDFCANPSPISFARGKIPDPSTPVSFPVDRRFVDFAQVLG